MQLMLLLLLLLASSCCIDFTGAAPTSSGHACPASSQSLGKCNSEKLRSLTIKYFVWNEDVGKCQSRIKMKEVPCSGAGGAKKNHCPEPRILEPGKCNTKTSREKTLVEHYEPDGKGGCKLMKSFTYPKCPDKPQPDTGCLEPRFYQKPCTGRIRQVFKFYYVPAAAAAGAKCVEKLSIQVEPCGALVSQHKCPPSRLVERGQCKLGFRTVMQEKYIRDPSGKCSSRSHYVTQPCSDAGSKQCPKTKVTKGPCRKGLRGMTKLYFVYDAKKRRCVRKFSIDTTACGPRKRLKCPKPRVVEPGPCTEGHTRVLVSHYEPDHKTGKCLEKKTFVMHHCGKEKVKEKDDDKCPDKKYSQSSCKEGFRNLFTFTFRFEKGLNRCVKHVALKKEACAALVPTTACKTDDTIERGPCSGGFRSNIVYHHSRNAKGRCVRKVVKSMSPCEVAPKPKCPPKQVKKLGECKDRLQRWMTVYFRHSSRKRRCIRAFRVTERPCGKSKTATFTNPKCPHPRVIEPGPCRSGKLRQLISHWEYDSKSKRCKEFKSFEVKACEEKSAKVEAKKSKKSKKFDCGDAKVSQSRCLAGYRTITTVYFYFEHSKGRCVRKIKQKTEKCAKLVKGSSCPSDATVESGPCKGGFRTNIVFKYSRDSSGSCRKKRLLVTLSCSSAAVSCPPKHTVAVGKCQHGIQRWLTTYYSYAELKKRCVKKLRFKEISCRKSKHTCPTPRVVEPGPCSKGKQRLLIEHYEFNAKLGKCEAMKDYTEKPCGSKSKPGESSKSKVEKHECPDPVFHQQPCRRKYRSVVKVYSEWSKVKGRCVKRIKMEDEPCAALVSTGCPADETVEAGPCNKGYRSNIVFSHKRDSKGKCTSVELRIVQPCGKGASVPTCPKRQRKKLKSCSKAGLEKWLTVYYVYSAVKKRCVRKLKFKELSCRAEHCPTPRVVEPGSCKHGSKRILIEHYELDAVSGKCKSKQDYVHKICGKPSARKLAAMKHGCPDSVFQQKPCRPDGYRTVVKTYFRFNASRGRCVKNVKVDNEKCSKLVAVKSSCHPDEVVETGPCKSGYKQNIVFKYSRAADGSCSRIEHRVTEKCTAD